MLRGCAIEGLLFWPVVTTALMLHDTCRNGLFASPICPLSQPTCQLTDILGIQPLCAQAGIILRHPGAAKDGDLIRPPPATLCECERMPFISGDVIRYCVAVRSPLHSIPSSRMWDAQHFFQVVRCPQ